MSVSVSVIDMETLLFALFTVAVFSAAAFTLYWCAVFPILETKARGASSAAVDQLRLSRIRDATASQHYDKDLDPAIKLLTWLRDWAEKRTLVSHAFRGRGEGIRKIAEEFSKARVNLLDEQTQRTVLKSCLSGAALLALRHPGWVPFFGFIIVSGLLRPEKAVGQRRRFVGQLRALNA